MFKKFISSKVGDWLLSDLTQEFWRKSDATQNKHNVATLRLEEGAVLMIVDPEGLPITMLEIEDATLCDTHGLALVFSEPGKSNAEGPCS